MFFFLKYIESYQRLNLFTMESKILNLKKFGLEYQNRGTQLKLFLLAPKKPLLNMATKAQKKFLPKMVTFYMGILMGEQLFFSKG